MAIFNRKNRALSRVLRNILRPETAGAAGIPTANTESVPANKAAGPAPAASAPAYSLPTDIPKSYDDTYVRAIPKDPQNTVVYWERPREETRICVFPDKGTAHVGNDEAARVQQQLWHNNNQQHDNGHHQHNNNEQWQNDNHRWLSENSHWLNNTKPWDNTNNGQRHGDNNHCQNGNNHQQGESYQHHSDSNAKAANVSLEMLANLISQCSQRIEGNRPHQYIPIPSSAEIYKINTEKRQ